MVEPAPALAAAIGVVPGGVQQLRVVADQRAALAGGHELALLHREAAERAVTAPTPRPRHCEPCACAQSSIRCRSAALAQRHEQVEVGDARPPTCTAMIARVRSRDRRLGGGDVDAERVGIDVDETGVALTPARRVATATNVIAGTITSSPSPTPQATSAASSVCVPFVNGQAARGPLEARELACEPVRAVAVPRPPGARVERREQLLALAIAPLWPGGIRSGVGYGNAAEQCGEAHASFAPVDGYAKRSVRAAVESPTWQQDGSGKSATRGTTR